MERYKGITEKIRSLNVGESVSFPINKYISACGIITRLNIRHRDEGLHWIRRTDGQTITVTRDR